eukprot:TRINITY_DN1208_c0_g2_i2.p1 TRINITY_DN1208_c0_g2~~TRINITY_DN1208_c0_g2_i2.p1  ORF type:complete len:710 (-),score=120.24 TRINITY_DN1208_c0_g2_i2:95-2224(-)
MKVLALLVFLSCCFCSFAVPKARERVGEWIRTHRKVDTTTHHTIRIALKQRNLNVLEQKFWSVSNPKSSDYGKYLNHEEISNIVSLPPKSLERISKWLTRAGAMDVAFNLHRDMVQASFAVRDLEKLFGTRFSFYHHPRAGRHILRSRFAVAIPDSVQDLVDIIHGLNDFPPVMRGRKADHEESQTSQSSTPYAPIFRSVGSRGDPNSIFATFTPVDSQGVPIRSKNFTAIVRWSALYLGQKVTGPSFFVSSGNECHFNLRGNKLICTIQIQQDFTFKFLTNFTLSVTQTGLPTGTAVYPFPVVATPSITPQKLWNYYRIPVDRRVVAGDFAQCVVEFEQQYYSPEDLQQFFAEMGLPSTTPVTVIGPNDPSQPGGEANLDIQWIMGMAVGVPTWFWSIKAESSEEIDDILEWAYAIGNTTNPPWVNSISYGMVASSVDEYLGSGYLRRSDVEFQKLALMGITIIIADGDNGAGDLGAPPMLKPDCSTRLNPDWPSQSAYITAVGSTYITPLAEPICYTDIDCRFGNPEGEVGVSLDNGLFWTTGGGFADYPARPQYQEAIISQYLQSNATLPPSSFFNSGGRAYPDISTVGHNLMTVISGSMTPVDGTSASAPIFAGIVSLLTDARLRAGKPALGFLNPLLYQIAEEVPDAFRDVVVGENKCSTFNSPDNDGSKSCCPYGFSASAGWDPVSGLGTPVYDVLEKAVLSV